MSGKMEIYRLTVTYTDTADANADLDNSCDDTDHNVEEKTYNRDIVHWKRLCISNHAS